KLLALSEPAGLARKLIAQAGMSVSDDFSPEQKRYLEGLAAGVQIARAARGALDPATAKQPSVPAGPDAEHRRSQDRVLTAGQKLSDQEKFKRELHPFDGYERLKAQAADNEPPKADDNFSWRIYGLFYCAPNQTAYMCRMHINNDIIKNYQLEKVEELSE